MSIVKRIIRSDFTCYMCKTYVFLKDKYTYRTFDFSPERPSIEFDVCTKCAIRESKYKKKEQLDKFLGVKT